MLRALSLSHLCRQCAVKSITNAISMSAEAIASVPRDDLMPNRTGGRDLRTRDSSVFVASVDVTGADSELVYSQHRIAPPTRAKARRTIHKGTGGNTVFMPGRKRVSCHPHLCRTHNAHLVLRSSGSASGAVGNVQIRQASRQKNALGPWR